MLVFVSEKLGPISHMNWLDNGKGKAHSSIHMEYKPKFCRLLVVHAISRGALHLVLDIYKLGWYNEGRASTVSGDFFLWGRDYLFLSHTL